jgi:OOP family OmpA-OmpF porin
MSLSRDWNGLRCVRAGALALIVAATAVSMSAAQGALVGGSLGSAKQYDYEVGGPIDRRDESDTAFRVFGGYMFHPNYGLALSYVDLGDAYYDGPAFGGFTDTLGADGWDLSFIGSLKPGAQERFAIFATVGLFEWKQDVRYQDASGLYVYEDSGTSPSISVGGEVSFGQGAHWGVHFNYQWFRDVGDEDNSGHEYDRSLISVGVDYRFGR